MDEKALFLKFWKREAPATRKVISRIPQERSDYRPDPKARNAREIAWLIVREEIILAEGLEKISEVRPQVMILDMRLPDTDGLSVLRQARELDPLLQVIVKWTDGLSARPWTVPGILVVS